MTIRELAAERWLTVPNALSLVRLAGVPVFLWLLLGPRADGWALIVLMIFRPQGLIPNRRRAAEIAEGQEGAMPSVTT